MAKYNQLTPLPFKGLTKQNNVCGSYCWPVSSMRTTPVTAESRLWKPATEQKQQQKPPPPKVKPKPPPVASKPKLQPGRTVNKAGDNSLLSSRCDWTTNQGSGTDSSVSLTSHPPPQIASRMPLAQSGQNSPDSPSAGHSDQTRQRQGSGSPAVISRFPVLASRSDPHRSHNGTAHPAARHLYSDAADVKPVRKGASPTSSSPTAVKPLSPLPPSRPRHRQTVADTISKFSLFCHCMLLGYFDVEKG